MTSELDNKNPATLCGALFAVLEKIQQDTSEGTLNKTIVDTYFSSACSRPVTVFPHLVDLSFKHLKKYKSIELRNYYKNLTLDIIADLEEKFPHTLSNDEQGMFIVAYAKQNRKLYTKKSEE